MGAVVTDRSEFDPVMAYPTPKGWAPEGTYTGVVGHLVGHRDLVDRWDTSPSPHPYPPSWPDLRVQPSSPMTNAKALRTLSKRLDEQLVHRAAGKADLREMRVLLRDVVAIKEELGTGVVLLSDEFQQILGGGE